MFDPTDITYIEILIAYYDNYQNIAGSILRMDDFHTSETYPGDGTITKPVSDELFLAGKKDTIKWQDYPPDRNLKLYYSFDNGNTYTELAEVTPEDEGMYIWDVPNTLAAKCKVKLAYADNDELFAESDQFIIKPYLLTRLESDGEMTGYDIWTDRWGFANVEEDMWPSGYYNQFDYNGIDPFTNQPYDHIQAPEFNAASPSIYVSWEAFVRAFTTDACYFDVANGIYSPMAVANWVADTTGWGGSCFAIAGSNALAFSKKGAFLSKYASFPAFNTPLSVTSSEALIDNLTQIYAHVYGDPTVQNWVNPPAWSVISPLQVVNELKTHFSQADVPPHSISLWHNTNSEGHCVLPYQLRQDTINEQIYYIDVYDNSEPNDLEANIVINLADNGGNGSWDYSNLPGWGGSAKLKLECDASVYLSPPILKKGERSDFILAGDRIRIGGNRFGDIQINDNQGNTAGYYDDKLKYDIEGSVPLIPPTGSFRKPYAYFLPNENYSVTLDNFTSKIANAFFFYNNKALIYKRTGTGELQTDRLTFGNDLSIVNPDGESKEAQLDLIIKEMDREKVFRLYPLPLDSEDSIRLESPDDSQVVLYNFGGAKEYGIELNSFSYNGFEWFVNDQVPIGENTSHTFDVNWTDVEESVLLVYVDEGMDDSNEDTLRLNQHITGIEENLNNRLLAELNLKVWPNPTRDNLTISYNLNKSSRVSINVFNSDGKEVMSALTLQNQSPGKQIVPLNLSNLPAGIYYYRVEFDALPVYGKIIKM